MIPPHQDLENFKLIKKMSFADIAKHYNVSSKTVQKWFKHYNIKYPKYGAFVKNEIPSKEILSNDLQLGFNINELSIKYDTSKSTIRRWLSFYDLTMEKRNFTTKSPPKQTLLSMYIDKNLTMKEIANEFGVCFSTVYKWFNYYKIDSNKIKYKIAVPLRSELINLRLIDKKTIQECASYFRVSKKKIYQWLDEYDIDKIYNYKQEKLDLDKDKLLELHFIKNKSCKEISEIFKCSDITIAKRIRSTGSDIVYRDYIKPSKAENEIKQFLLDNEIITNKSRSILHGRREIDLYSPEHKIGIEYCGIYWHNEKNKPANYHYLKMKECRDNGIHLITIFENEWFEKNEIIKSILLSKFNKSHTRIYARNCRVMEINTKVAKEFLNENHLQGSPVHIKLSVGLYFNNLLIAVMTFSNHHRQNQTNIVLSRLAFSKNTNVIGGASKLFKYALNFINNDIISWSDNRWSNGKVYEMLGFIKENEYKQDYQYQKNNRLYSKQSFQKKKINCPPELTEREFCESLGYTRIWDCGKIKWVYKINK